MMSMLVTGKADAKGDVECVEEGFSSLVVSRVVSCRGGGGRVARARTSKFFI